MLIWFPVITEDTFANLWWICDIMIEQPNKEIVQGAVAGSRILSSLKENRVEVIGCLILAHLLGVSDRILAQFSGVCI